MRKSVKILTGTLLSGGACLYLLPLFFPLPDGIDQPPEQGAILTDRDGTPLRRFLTEEGLRADSFASLDEIPQHLVNATIAVEDQRFHRHLGVDYIGMCRAVRDSAARRRFVSGASTISQQLIKISSPQRKRSFGTKFIEINSARKLEFFHSKETILAAYLNRLPYGNQLTGCRSAARRYFDKPVSDLSLAESAFLAGLPNRPSYLNPYRNLPAAKKRQQLVLNRMLEEKLISQDEFDVAVTSPLTLQTGTPGAFHAPHFVDLYLQQRGEPAASQRTSLNLSLQNEVEKTITSRLEKIDRNGGIHCAAVVIHNLTGEIRALAGSRDFFGSKDGQINGAWQPRSAGSTLKPFTYLMALEKGYTAASILADTPVEYVSSAGAYQPVNFDRTYQGPVTFRRALATSLNIPAVRLLKETGGPRALHSMFTDELKFTSLHKNGDIYGLGLTIGNAEVRLLELTNAYACLARLGKWKPYTFIRTAESVPGTLPECTWYNPANAWIIADILSDNSARAPAFGYNSALRFPWRVAAKTGTSTDFRDSWTLGFTPEYTVGVWMGRFDNQPLPDSLTGALGAGPVFHDIVLHIHKDHQPTWYPRPENVVEKTIDTISGKIVPADFKPTPMRTEKEYFHSESLPPIAKSEDYAADGKTLLSSDYAEWWKDPLNPLKNAAALQLSGDQHLFEVLSPKDGTIAYLDPDLPSGGQRFPLRCKSPSGAEILWESTSLKIEKRGNLRYLLLEEGEHYVEAVHPVSGERKRCRITVERL